MLHGVGGQLVSEDFLEREFATPLQTHRPSSLAAARKELIRWRVSCLSLGPASSVRAIAETAGPMLTHLGFEPLSRIEIRHDCAAAVVRSAGRAVAFVAASWGDRLDPLWRVAVTTAIRASARWAILFNGLQLRVVDPTRVYARRFLEFDLDLVLDDEATFAVFWSLVSAGALTAPGRAAATVLHDVVSRSELFASGVSQSLRLGVLAASADVIGALLKPSARRREPPPLGETFEQALTIVYRILFLLFAEAGGLVPLWHPVYRDSYSMEALRSLVERPRAVRGLWEALRAMARLAHAGCRVGDLHVTPFNGRLFAPHRTPLADRPGLDDEAARRAVLALSTRPVRSGDGIERIAYRDLGVEQLGAVYETLLEYEPRLVAPQDRLLPGKDAPARGPVILVRGSTVRKSTGSFYTPQTIADYLVRRTLGPLVMDAPPERILRLRVVDPAAGSGAFLVAACRYLADAYEASLVRGGGCRTSDFGGRERVLMRRAIAERCLFGVDVNPTAVQLARLSLWLATLAADRPLTFLDHHLQVGDSLAGAWLSHLRHPPRVGRGRATRGDASLPLFDERAIADVLRDALPARFRLADDTGDSIDAVRQKERSLAELNRHDSLLSRWKRAADAWCAVWFADATGTQVPASVYHALSDAILHGRGPLPDATAGRYLNASESVARVRRFFHWELEFPEAFFAADGSRLPDGGFDAVIGNPPWDMIRNDRATSAGARRADASAFVRFSRESGIYSAQSEGHANRYQLFVERAIALTRPGGRLGLVLPGGFVTDHGSARLRRRLLDECRIDALVGFGNERGVFPIHRSVRFVLATASRGLPTDVIACRLGEQDPASLEEVGTEPASRSSWFTVRVSRALIDHLSGDSLTIPDVRHPTDVAILERAASLYPPLGRDDGWRARFGRELNVTEDRKDFRPAPGGLPVVEGKQIRPFGVDLGSSRFSIDARTARRLLEPARYERPRLAYRDVASATNRLTLIAAILPSGCVSTHTVFCLRTALGLKAQQFLCGLFNSFVVNYFVRMRVTTHVTTAVVERLPIPPPDACPREFRQIAALARLLARASSDAGYATLQALAASVYRLSVDEFAHVLTTFPLVSEETRRTALACYQEMMR